MSKKYIYGVKNIDMIVNNRPLFYLKFNDKNNIKDEWDFFQSMNIEKNRVLFSLELSNTNFNNIKNKLLYYINKYNYVGNASEYYYEEIVSNENIKYNDLNVNMIEKYLLDNEVEYTKLSQEDFNKLIC